jgi:hypothetical protein
MFSFFLSLVLFSVSSGDATTGTELAVVPPHPDFLLVCHYYEPLEEFRFPKISYVTQLGGGMFRQIYHNYGNNVIPTSFGWTPPLWNFDLSFTLPRQVSTTMRPQNLPLGGMAPRLDPCPFEVHSFHYNIGRPTLFSYDDWLWRYNPVPRVIVDIALTGRWGSPSDMALIDWTNPAHSGAMSILVWDLEVGGVWFPDEHGYISFYPHGSSVADNSSAEIQREQ